MPLRKRILVVEDNDLNRAILCEILSASYNTIEADNGKEALELLRTTTQKVDLILLDLMMPIMNGYEFLDELKKDKELSLIPVIVTTQNESEDDEIAALSHGATDFVPKPYRPQVILHRIKSLITFKENSAIVSQVKYDKLTGLYSKNFFYRKANELISENPNKKYSIICTNIENFKLYNDIFGLKKGDELLRNIADNIRKHAHKNTICGRYEADRFLLIREREQEKHDRELFFNTQIPLIDNNVILKWGIYEINDKSISIEQSCDRALLAVDSIKGQYNIHFALYDDVMREKMIREKAITDVMEKAIEENQFIVYLQPKYDLNNDTMAGAEALVRWIHPTWGFMSPAEFIPLFEKNGFITSLDLYVWERALQYLQEFKLKGYPMLPISVNVSRADIYQTDIVKKLLDLTKKYDIEPKYLHLEITETAYAEDPGKIIETVEILKAHGFILEMDDFGSGYSSLNMLNDMKLDILKLDTMFIQSEMSKPISRSILRFIINLAHWMGLTVVAEGVETADQVQRLRNISCDYVQGYFFSRPIPKADFEELLKAHKCHKPTKLSIIRNEGEKCETKAIVIIDDDKEYSASVAKVFEKDYEVFIFESPDKALSFIKASENISAIILSMTLKNNQAKHTLDKLHQDPDFWKIPILSLIQTPGSATKLDRMLDTDDFLCKCHPLSDLRRRVEHIINIASIQEREAILQEEASHDYLSGLLNRRGFQVAINHIRREELPVTMCIFDMDDLKKLNDTFGHEKGDLMIKTFAEHIKKNTRSNDILCRYGGDEFIVILKNINDKKTVLAKMEYVCNQFKETLRQENIQVACSCGIVVGKDGERPTKEMIEAADKALYRAKSNNKGSCSL
ncbi:EAL domain-containing protein [Bullifex sp.]|uniref:EAL domain-containing protein n=1 Tax=Bullifex sp. TaxID=2815808 RepID=UPI002A819FF1|nr:EAL domain-containing protein [Bullifex sp.]MDY4067069.1 EAL domain-containing protein [Bullifex sp.]